MAKITIELPDDAKDAFQQRASLAGYSMNRLARGLVEAYTERRLENPLETEDIPVDDTPVEIVLPEQQQQLLKRISRITGKPVSNILADLVTVSLPRLQRATEAAVKHRDAFLRKLLELEQENS